MGRIVRALRNTKKHNKTILNRREDLRLPNLNGEALIKRIIHERGRTAPLAEVVYEKDGKKIKTMVAALEGMHEGQIISVGASAPVKVANVLHLKDIPEGMILSMVERLPYDGGIYAKSAGTNVQVVMHNRKDGKTTVKLPSGKKLELYNECRAFIGLIASGGCTDKPLLRAGTAHYKYRSRGIAWPKTRGVAMNPVDHPHGGGNHQHVGHPTTVSKTCAPNARVGLIGARRTGIRKGSRKVYLK